MLPLDLLGLTALIADICYFHSCVFFTYLLFQSMQYNSTEIWFLFTMVPIFLLLLIINPSLQGYLILNPFYPFYPLFRYREEKGERKRDTRERER